MRSLREDLRGAVPVGALIALVLALGACSGGATEGAAAPVPSVPDAKFDATHRLYPKLTEIVLRSDLVVRGHVTAVSAGRTVTTDFGDSIGFRDVEIAVDELLFSRLATAPATVVAQEDGWAGGQSVEDRDLPWAAVGDRGIFVLTTDPAAPSKFSYVGVQGRLLEAADGYEMGGAHELALNERMHDLTRPQLLGQLRAAIVQVKASKAAKPAGASMQREDA